jgi:hypothetical protein
MSTTHAREGLNPAESRLRKIDDGEHRGPCLPGVPSGIPVRRPSEPFLRIVPAMSKPEDPAIKCLSDRSHWCRFEFDVVHHWYLHERVSRGIAEVDYGSELAASAGSYWLA